MRMMMRVHIDAIHGTEALKSGAAQKAIAKFSETFKPEASYFLPDDGMRSCIFVFDMRDSQQLPEIAEPFFDLGYKVMLSPCMTRDDLMTGLGHAGL
jgi:hypothetical protein